MSVIGLIGGSGAGLYPGAADVELLNTGTDWGPPSAALQRWEQHGHEIYFLARHGETGGIPPHKVNYRANVQALADVGAEYVVAMNAVGGIAADAVPGSLVIPEQLIDYTSGRLHTYYDGSGRETEFVEFTEPYNNKLRFILIKAAGILKLPVIEEGVYGVTQGPRLETVAEIDRLERDGCSIVGMTSMPEAGLARELGLQYVSCCSVVNYAAGRSDAAIHSEIEAFLELGIEQSAKLIDQFLRDI
jgi:5'-methylthioinosine phosphorylase